jgi:ATP-binding cassette subfamily F protein uup
MALLTLADAHLAYGHVPLLDGAALAIDPGERVALIGRNGSGKSSLLKVLAGLEALDDGVLQFQGGAAAGAAGLALVAQEPAFAEGASVFDTVAEGVAEARALRSRFEAHAEGDALEGVQARLDALGGWNWEQRVEQAIARLSLPGAETAVASLSGGTKKRVALARALVAEPALLLLDEPTNHLDIAAIEWLEALLAARAGTLVFVSHDRAFIDAVATRIVELDRGVLRSYPGAFTAYEAAKAREAEAEALAAARQDKLLAQEEVWVRQGVEARRTRSVARVQRLEALREARRTRREALGRVRMEIDAGARSGRVVAELEGVGIAFGGRRVIDGFTATVLRGDKVGLIGPNGSGKTTLLKLFLGELEPGAGRVRRGTKLQVAYFDQLRAGLDLEATLAHTVSPGSDWIELGSTRRHVIGWLEDFLFPPQRAQAPVSTLSGGERNRLLLARLFALPANVLVLDEPTNDLDIETLDLLEERLSAYTGTVFLVSHDRRFLDRVVTSTIAWDGDPAFGGRPGRWREYEGGYEDWLVQRARQRVEAPAAPAPKPSARPPSGPGPASAGAPAGATPTNAPAGATPTNAPAGAQPKKLGYKESRELEALPARIEALEAEQKAISERLADGRWWAEDAPAAAAAQARHGVIEEELMAALERWEALAARA